jgi:hypothetical protein
MDLIDFSWWWKAPIDFEYKQYELLGYLKKVDEAFMEKKLSPWLLHSEKILDDMKTSRERLKYMDDSFSQKKISFIQGAMFWETNKIPKSSEIEVLEEILDFSIPLLEAKVVMGRIILKRNPMLLWG